MAHHSKGRVLQSQNECVTFRSSKGVSASHDKDVLPINPYHKIWKKLAISVSSGTPKTLKFDSFHSVIVHMPSPKLLVDSGFTLTVVTWNRSMMVGGCWEYHHGCVREYPNNPSHRKLPESFLTTGGFGTRSVVKTLTQRRSLRG